MTAISLSNAELTQLQRAQDISPDMARKLSSRSATVTPKLGLASLKPALTAGKNLGFDTFQVGTSYNDTLIGGSGADILAGLGGNDRLAGQGGADWIFGGAGNDRLFGGAGNDRLFGGAGNDRMFGGTGNDRLFGGAGRDRLYGGTGNDRLFGGAGNDRLYGGNDRDYLNGGAGDDNLFGGAGNDRLRGGAGNNQLNGGSGVDRVLYAAAAGPVTLRYDIDFVDNAGATPTDTEVELQLLHSTGTDVLDNIEQIIAPAGQNNRIDFSDVYIQPYRSLLPPTRLSPPIQADLAAGTLSYEQTQLQIQNFQSVTGSFQDDVISGNAQNNTLNGSFGNDTLDGRAGDDLLIGNGGDVLTGGSGADTFRLEASSIRRVGPGQLTVYSVGNDLTDFVSGVDRLELVQQNNTRMPLPSQPFQAIFNGFEALSLGTLSSSEFFTVADTSQIAPQVAGVYYVPSSGELYYREPGSFPPAGFQPFATIQGGGTITASDIVVV